MTPRQNLGALCSYLGLTLVHPQVGLLPPMPCFSSSVHWKWFLWEQNPGLSSLQLLLQSCFHFQPF